MLPALFVSLVLMVVCLSSFDGALAERTLYLYQCTPTDTSVFGPVRLANWDELKCAEWPLSLDDDGQSECIDTKVFSGDIPVTIQLVAVGEIGYTVTKYERGKCPDVPDYFYPNPFLLPRDVLSPAGRELTYFSNERFPNNDFIFATEHEERFKAFKKAWEAPFDSTNKNGRLPAYVRGVVSYYHDYYGLEALKAKSNIEHVFDGIVEPCRDSWTVDCADEVYRDAGGFDGESQPLDLIITANSFFFGTRVRRSQQQQQQQRLSNQNEGSNTDNHMIQSHTIVLIILGVGLLLVVLCIIALGCFVFISNQRMMNMMKESASRGLSGRGAGRHGSNSRQHMHRYQRTSSLR